MPLTLLKPGDRMTIRRVGGSDEVKQHLTELGFVTGETVSVVSEAAGNLIIHIKDSRVALDRNMASRIMV